MELPWLQPALETFERFLEAGRLPHALLLSGPSGCGKQRLAVRICRDLLCAQGGCGECRSCTLYEGGAHPEFRAITFEEHPRTGAMRTVITVDQLRAVVEAMTRTTTVSDRKVALIFPAEAMNQNAANALLKTLEEPPGNAVLLLVSDNPARLPNTIRSRCQRIDVQLPDREQARDWLARETGADGEAVTLALKAAADKPLVARELLESDSVQAYRNCMEILDAVGVGRMGTGKALSDLADSDIRQIWIWLSLRSAEALRKISLQSNSPVAARRMAELQRKADRNRLLAATPVRDDLLLREWLLQWRGLCSDS